ncbi:uncharacterized protein [Paramisgurnus dabryanus]|uniref:uncharacterized protein n=1 Tax=Paramisgurnus dabryanus TaxID=90735 RepID=UPI003CCEFDB3
MERGPGLLSTWSLNPWRPPLPPGGKTGPNNLQQTVSPNKWFLLVLPVVPRLTHASLHSGARERGAVNPACPEVSTKGRPCPVFDRPTSSEERAALGPPPPVEKERGRKMNDTRRNCVRTVLAVRGPKWRAAAVVFGDEVKSVSVMEGDSVTLHTDTKLQIKDEIEWMFGVESPDEIIAEYNREANTTSLNDERFKNHLYLNHQTGDLIITNITNKHTGVYRVEINRQPSVIFRHFSVTVYAPLPVPVISRDSSQCSSSSRCVLLCSVMNVRDVSLSWYKGNSLLSIISVSDLKIRLSLHLEVEYQDKNTYRCVLNNTITNQTQHLNIKNLCQRFGVDCCGFTEAVIRLVVSALVGVAAVTFLIYDIRSR